ncbi:hypothetical protein [Oceanirhabdus sp. W0125-5]|uniref:hypothetical protein n=1 Tax=Oceanirhabdus sp. W0125-5 TaxID=2999116 RepID=UPI0022F322E4|nr:hypothetical protein [Oceanirhabdus sp. W0125-5]WBW96013.1 hypothetical protein OW730_20310 [Oceanirhabdus sp. W0125-5]
MMKKESKLIMVEESKLKELRLGLNELKLSVGDQLLRKKVERLINLFEENGTEEQEESIADKIYKKMKETEDSELNVKLYMLYRKLEEGKVDEAEALRQYNIFIGQEYKSSYVF